MITFKVLLFAGLHEICGTPFLSVTVTNDARVMDLIHAAEQLCPSLVGQVFRVAVDSRYVAAETKLPALAEIAFIPPVSGG
jgi:molybdopterin converting factor small subunit